MDQKHIGEFIKQLRKKNNLTQKELANKLGVTYQAVSKWETGKNIPDIIILKEISRIYKIDIEELLVGKSKNNKKKIYIILTIIAILFVATIIIIVTIYHKEHTNFEFKTMTSTCEEFTITGSAAYNKDKTSIYISDVDYCGKENNNIYKSIECILYEEYKDTKTKIGTCDNSRKEVTLAEFLETVEINVNNYIASCKMFANSSLSLEIQTTSHDNKKITYQIPIKLEENCEK